MNVKALILLFFCVFIFNISYAGELASGEVASYYNRGVEAQKSGNFKEAHVSYQKALILAPQNITYQKFILNNVGIIYIKQGDFRMAEEAFRDALNIDSGYKAAQLNLGLIYDMKGDKIKALRYWAEVFELDKLKPKTFVVEEKQ